MGDKVKLDGPDLAKGADVTALADGGMLLGHAHGEPVLLARRGGEIFAVGATCTHWSGPLAEGLVVGDTVRCPWHQACFDLRTGAPSAPAMKPIPCYALVRSGDRVTVGARLDPEAPQKRGSGVVVIVGAGAAGGLVAESLRRRGFDGAVVLLGAEGTAPVDRPNLSKDYLAGDAPEAWMELRSADWYAEQRIDFRRDARVVSIDTKKRSVALASGEELAYDELVIATGAEPRKLDVKGGERAHLLRTLADTNAIIERAKSAKHAVVIGASFIGLEAAASLKKRGLDVHVVGPEAAPLARVLGQQLSAMVRKVHEDNGVVFHLGRTVARIEAEAVVLDDGTQLPGDLVVAGVGVEPRTALAELAGLRVDRGIVVDEHLRVAPHVYAIGDVARFPDRDGQTVRIEHWVVAQRQGEHVARCILGDDAAFRDVPFFWTTHFGVTVSYVGHAETWDRIEVDGDPMKQDACVRYWRGDRLLAVATVGRDDEALEAARDLGA